ncbi:MAG: TetR/AcrR family transcriptional regulator [Rhodobacteraceae bacterium]|nr:TetR/AcrR family transcriptional regulator [Paracoccaceae bacterium]MBR9822604.1 TetR/AcrR family transcriptional regulator [Paracoccaceae bacterium]
MTATTTQEKTPAPARDLRRDLVEAGIALLEEGGLAGLGLRKCAARAKVSHAAPAHHFAGIEGLRTAIAAEGFRRFRRTMEEAAAGVTGPRARLRAICLGYLGFARQQPALYDLIFSIRAETMAPELATAARAAYAVLAACCAPLTPPGADPRLLEAHVWTACHGYAMLSLSRCYADDLPEPEQFLGFIDRFTAP